MPGIPDNRAPMTSFFLFLALLVAVASLAGVGVSRCLPWSDVALRARVDIAAGVTMGPLLAAVATTGALWAWPGAQPFGHAALVGALLMAVAVVGHRLAPRRARAPAPAPRRIEGAIALAVAAGYFGALVFDTAVVPLIQNDALEYATVGRILYEARSLSAYPAVRPAESASGFYGPWTHPPSYVALIYLANVLQGHADSARAMRWISPWCLVAGTYLVASLGAMRSPRVGWTAGLIFASTPILFLGASSALIDPLPVSGMALALAGLVALRMDGPRAAAAWGLMLGLGLWTHSQAILFPCLLLPLLWWVAGPRPGDASVWRQLPRCAGLAAVAVAVAVVVGGLPYLRNLGIFGSLISDNPVVFAHRPLQWAEYFAWQRGLASFGEILQYGVLKGFFAIEAYSVAFWLALPGAWKAIGILRRARWGDAGRDPADVLVGGAALLWLMYLGATALSAALGIDLMIRNERYLLVMMPAIGLLVADGLLGDAERPDARWWPRLRRMVLVALAVSVPLQLAVLLSYRQSQLRGDMASFAESAQIERWPPFAVVKHLKRSTEPDAVAFSMKPADMFYAGRRMVSYLDPAAIPFYDLAQDPERAFEELKRLHVTHVHMPDYFLPPVYMSALMDLMADPSRTRLRAESEGYQLYELVREGGAASPSWQALEVPSGWTLQTHAVLAGRKTRMRVVTDSRDFRLGEASANEGVAGMFHRDSARVILSPTLDVGAALQGCRSQGRNAELLVEASFTGRAYVQVMVLLSDASGRQLERRVVGDRPTLADEAPTRIVRRSTLGRDVQQLRLMVEHRGDSRLNLRSAALSWRCAGDRSPAAVASRG